MAKKKKKERKPVQGWKLYQVSGNKIERKRVDIKFYSNLVTKAHMEEWCASAFLAAVRVGGAEAFGLSFSWGFAHKD